MSKNINDEIMQKSDELWKKIQDGLASTTLIIGAGVTQCVVGSWNGLLNEVAVQRFVNEAEGVYTPDQLLCYTDTILGGVLLPNDVDVLEKGEYLMYDPNDYIEGSGLPLKAEEQREKIFAHRVYTAIERLKRRQLRRRDFIQDFLDWHDNCRYSLGKIKLNRRDMADSQKLHAYCEKLTVSELVDVLNAWDQRLIKCDRFRDYALISDSVIEKIQMHDAPGLQNLLSVRLSKDIMQRISDPADKDLIQATQLAKDCLLETIQTEMRMPDYGTLDAVLNLCLRGKIKKVITYNFDTVFDRLLADENVQQRFHKQDTGVLVYGIQSAAPWIFRAPKSDNCRLIEIYHVHGMLDADYHPENQMIIFSESAYEAYQSNPFNLGCSGVASAWQTGHLLCVGFSGTDANFRFIMRELIRLKNSTVRPDNSETRNVYLLRTFHNELKKYGLTENADQEELDYAYHCFKTYINMANLYFEKKAGTRLIWCEDFAEIVDKLNKIAE